MTRDKIKQRIAQKKSYKKNIEKIKQRCRENPHNRWSSKTLYAHGSRGYTIEIKFKELLEIAKNTTHCFYCGKPLVFKSYAEIPTPVEDAQTLDNIDCCKVLRKDNVRVICHRCNTTKGHRTHEEFIEYCKSLASKF